MPEPRYFQTATSLRDGRVLVAGGAAKNGSVYGRSSALYNQGTGTWAPAGRLNVPRYGHAAALLPSGRVLVLGGDDNGAILTSAEVFRP